MSSYHLLGSIRIAATCLFITPLLLACDSGALQWANRYERLKLGDVQARSVDMQALSAAGGRSAFWAGLLIDPLAVAAQQGANADMAASLYRRAIEGGVGVAAHNLAMLAIRSRVPLVAGKDGRPAESIVGLLDTAAKAGCVSSMLLQGSFYAKGAPGFARNEVLSADAYEKAANFSRDPRAQFELGRMLLDGRGRPRDVRQGVQLLTAAAAEGMAPAAAELAARAASAQLKARWVGVAALIDPSQYLKAYDQARRGLSVRDLSEVEAALAVWRDAYSSRPTNKLTDPTAPWDKI